jgi:hypothetical protein
MCLFRLVLEALSDSILQQAAFEQGTHGGAGLVASVIQLLRDIL